MIIRTSSAKTGTTDCMARQGTPKVTNECCDKRGKKIHFLIGTQVAARTVFSSFLKLCLAVRLAVGHEILTANKG